MDPITLALIFGGLALQIVGTLIGQAGRQDSQRSAPSGVTGSAKTGGDNPLAFIIGRYATAGQFEYHGAWGNAGETPNAYYTRVVSVSDLPVRGFSGFFFQGKRLTLAGSPTGDLGYAVTEFPDHMWIKWYDGTQTTADPLLLSAFGADPDAPWQSDMIGRGVAYFIVTCLFKRELYNSLPTEFLAEVDGIDLDDPRGDDAQDNTIVQVRGLMLGLSYDGRWIYGPQGIVAAQLPSANWEAGMDACDATVALSGGGSEPAFRTGFEVTVDTEPQALIGELLKGCNGRIAEIGGLYKVLVGAPGDPVYSFTDEDIVITQGQSFDPFPGLEDTHNAIEATYPEPAEGWQSRAAPPRYSDALEALDNDRRLPFSTDYKAVPYGNQVQRLMEAAIQEARRFRKHSFTGPGEWWEFEPLDPVAWTSARNGYDAKGFLITALDDLPVTSQLVALQENEPSDYGWSSDKELAFDLTAIPIIRPAAQAMSGAAVSPYIFVDATGGLRRPGMLLEWSGGLPDIASVAYEVREGFGAGNTVATGELLYDVAVASPAYPIGGQWTLPNAAYQVRLRFIPIGPRETIWSSWLSVTTPDVRVASADLSTALRDFMAFTAGTMRNFTDELLRVGQTLAEQDIANQVDKQELLTTIAAAVGDVNASFAESVTVVATDLAAAVDRIVALQASYNDLSAGALFRMQTVAGADGGYSRIALQTRFNVGDAFVSAGDYWESKSDGTSRAVRQAAKQYFVDENGNLIAMFDATGAYFNVAAIGDATIGRAKIATAAIGTLQLDDGAVTALGSVTGSSGTYDAATLGGSARVTIAAQSSYPITVGAIVTLTNNAAGTRTYTALLQIEISAGVFLALQSRSFDLGAGASVSLMAGAVATPPTSGSYNYSLWLTVNSAGNTTVTSPKITAAYPQK